MKKQKISGNDTDKALAKAATATPDKAEKLKTDQPVAEKDEVKQAEEEQRKRMKNQNA